MKSKSKKIVKNGRVVATDAHGLVSMEFGSMHKGDIAISVSRPTKNRWSLSFVIIDQSSIYVTCALDEKQACDIGRNFLVNDTVVSLY